MTPANSPIPSEYAATKTTPPALRLPVKSKGLGRGGFLGERACLANGLREDKTQIVSLHSYWSFGGLVKRLAYKSHLPRDEHVGVILNQSENGVMLLAVWSIQPPPLPERSKEL